MGLKFLSVAVVAAVFGACGVQAQSVSRIGGPANLPPAGFTGQQFVDNRGCVFLKAGYGGQTTWVPRVGRDRKVMCGVAPSGQARAAIEVATAEDMARPALPEAPAVMTKPVKMAAGPTVAPAVEPRTAPPVMRQPIYAPMPQTAPMVAAAPRQAAPYAQTAPRGTYEVAAGNGPGRGQIGCFTTAPVAERVKLRNGGTAVVCTRGDGSTAGWRSPVYPRSAGVGAALSDPVAPRRASTQAGNSYQANSGQANSGQGTAYQADSYASGSAAPTPPAGYKLAWTDGRLNPNRGKGTASGWNDQDQVWTRKVPSRLVEDQPGAKRKKKVVYVQSGSNVTVSTKGQPTAPVVQKQAARAGAYIQVGTFGVAANADGASQRLKGIGLPVARAKITSGGKAMQIVLAGPFGSSADAQTALSMARRAGFGDAFIR